jgi:hypothetical protein
MVVDFREGFSRHIHRRVKSHSRINTRIREMPEVESEREKDDLVVGRCHGDDGLREPRAKAQWGGSDLPLSDLFEVV